MNTMAQESFVPFTTARISQTGESGTRNKPLPRGGDRAGFVPGMPGAAPTPTDFPASSTAPASTAPHAAAPSATVVAPRAHAEHAKPVVSLRREGDKVVGIRVECTCGSVIELDCVY